MFSFSSSIFFRRSFIRFLSLVISMVSFTFFIFISSSVSVFLLVFSSVLCQSLIPSSEKLLDERHTVENMHWIFNIEMMDKIYKILLVIWVVWRTDTTIWWRNERRNGKWTKNVEWNSKTTEKCTARKKKYPLLLSPVFLICVLQRLVWFYVEWVRLDGDSLPSLTFFLRLRLAVVTFVLPFLFHSLAKDWTVTSLNIIICLFTLSLCSLSLFLSFCFSVSLYAGWTTKPYVSE